MFRVEANWGGKSFRNENNFGGNEIFINFDAQL